MPPRLSTETLLATVGVRSRARQQPSTISLGRPTGPPTTRTALGELGTPLGAVRLLGAAPRLAAAPRGDGHLVVDIPGWKAPELSGLPLRRYLRRLGYDARGWGFGTNIGDTTGDIDRLADRVLELVEDTGSPASLVGWSLGGVIAREVARRHPDAVRRVITYGTPVSGPTYTTVARAYTRGPDPDGHREARRLDETNPIPVPLTVLFSRRDGVVAWQACIDRTSTEAEHIEISSTHLGMGVDPDVWAIVADRLAGGTPDRDHAGSHPVVPRRQGLTR